MEITVLTENSTTGTSSELIAEKGLSLVINHNGERTLFDAGIADAFMRNAASLGIDLREIIRAVLSHHHFDHGGGLPLFLDHNQSADIYLRSRVEGECFFSILGPLGRYVGLDQDMFRKHAPRFQFVDDITEIAPGMFIIAPIKQPYPTPRGNRYLFLKSGATRVPDTWRHELIMVVKLKSGLVVFTGCSHSGVVNIIETVREHFEGQPIRTLIGGFHLIGLPFFNSMAGSKREVRDLAHQIEDYNIDKIYTGHCTGKKAFGVLKEVLGEKLQAIPTGAVFEC